LTIEFDAELIRYVAVLTSIEEEAAEAHEAVEAAKAAREPELDPIRLNLGRLLIRIRPTLGADFEQWCDRQSQEHQFRFSVQTAYKWMKIARAEDPKQEYLKDKAATAERVRESRARKGEKVKAEASAETMAAEAKSAADRIKLDPPVEPRPAGHIQLLPDDGLPTVHSIGRMIARDDANSKHTLLTSVLALSREDLEWLRDRIEEHLAEPTAEDEAARLLVRRAPTPTEAAE
jgi:transposase-like protein